MSIYLARLKPEKHWFQLAQRDYKISQKLPVNFAKTFQATFVI
jgi:hypothetical protein